MTIYLVLYLVSFPFVHSKKSYTDWWKRFWCATAMFILGIQLKVKYECDENILPDTYLTVCNHTTFMDPVVVLAILKGMPVAKAEIAKYPLIGFAAKRTGIIWVERDNIRSRAAAKYAVEDALQSGHSVLLYPEGTISYSPTQLRPFKKGSFHAAKIAGVPVLYCALFYESKKAYWQEENSLLKQFFIHFSTWRQKVHIHISQAHDVDNPKTESKAAQKWVQREIISIAEAAQMP